MILVRFYTDGETCTEQVGIQHLFTSTYPCSLIVYHNFPSFLCVFMRTMTMAKTMVFIIVICINYAEKYI